jgi:MFS transporter, putative metabolite:H+ symporter
MTSNALDYLPLNRRHVLTVLVCALGSFWDVVEINVGNVLSTVYSGQMSGQISATYLPLLLSSTYLGAIFGSPTLGLIADRYGRRAALIGTLMILTATSLLTAFSREIQWLILFRVLTGLAIGAFPPLMVAYLTDLMPIRERGKMVLVAAGIGFLAAPATLFGARFLASFPSLSIDAWRWVCGGGGVGAALTALLFLRLSESPRWLRTQRQFTAAERAEKQFESSTPLFSVTAPHSDDRDPHLNAPVADPRGPVLTSAKDQSRSIAFKSVLIGVLNLLSPWSTVGFALLSGAALRSKGFSVKDSLLFTAMMASGAVVGLIVGSLRVDRTQRRTALFLYALSMVVSQVIFGLVAFPIWLVVSGFIFSISSAMYVVVLGVYTAELFPTHRRAFATSAGWAVNRTASVLVPLALLPLLKSEGSLAMFGVMAGTLLASITILAFAPLGLANKPIT